jgi:hypothetical protein
MTYRHTSTGRFATSRKTTSGNLIQNRHVSAGAGAELDIIEAKDLRCPEHVRPVHTNGCLRSLCSEFLAGSDGHLSLSSILPHTLELGVLLSQPLAPG